MVFSPSLKMGLLHLKGGWSRLLCREQAGQQRNEGNADHRHTTARHELFYPQLGVKLCSMAGGGVSKNI